jgi:ADP-L-glycero-D-manno-heptose 6-epimerase
MSMCDNLLKSKTYLITGGAGFIGSNIALALHSRGAKTIISDRLRSADKWKNIQELTIQDIVRPELLIEWLKEHACELSGIIHMGAISATTERDVDKIIDNNFILSTQLWKISSENGLPLIYASSAATYGDGKRGFDDNQTLQSQSALRPLNPYGWSKLLVDKRIASDIELGLPMPPQWAGLKFFNVYGPNEGHKGDMRSVINKLYPLIKHDKDVTLFKSYKSEYRDGGQLRDFIYVKDCVQVILWLLENPHVSGLFNVGTGQPRSFIDLVKSLDHVMHKNSAVHYIDMPEDIRDRYQYYTCANISKLRQVGYHSEFTTLEMGITDYVHNYLSK